MKTRSFGKKTLALFLAVLFVASCVPVVNLEAEAATASGYVWPVDGGVMSQGYYAAGNSSGHATHYGIDIVAYYDAPIKAINNGTVLCASTASSSANAICYGCNRKGAGYHVAILHTDGMISYYAHMCSVWVQNGDYVYSGQQIGGMGSTGNSDGTHLHFSIFSGSIADSCLINPLGVISPFSSVYVTDITETSANIWGVFGASAPNIGMAGICIGTDPNNMVTITEEIWSNGINSDGSYITGLMYGTSKWYGQLNPDTTYYYRVWMHSYDQTYFSDIQSFVTGGTHTHKWGDAEILKAASCTEQGQSKKTCLQCGSEEYLVIPMISHQYIGGYTVDVEATCTTAGCKSQYCLYGCNTRTNITEIPAMGHSFGGWTLTTPPSIGQKGEETRTCGTCGETETRDVDALIPEYEEKALLASKTVRPGEEFEVLISFENMPNLVGIAIDQLSYDTEKFELVSGEWAVKDPLLQSWKNEEQMGVCAFGEEKDCNGAFFRLVFRAKDGLEDGQTRFTCNVIARTKIDGKEEIVSLSVIPGVITVQNVLLGDMDGDDLLTIEDAIYLLYHVNFPQSYIANQSCNFDGDSAVTLDDAIYLLYHINFPNSYPLQ